MTLVAIILVALPIIIGVYAYVLYPAILRVMAAWTGSPRGVRPTEPLPLVTIVIVGYNEETQIRGAIEAVVGQDYPSDRRQILIVSDCSSDRTDDIVREYAGRGVELLRMPVRGGKTAAENAAAALIRGEIVVNTDASVRLDRAAVRLLVDAMADPSVGVASTRNVSITSGEDGNRAEASYTGYEMRVRSLETKAGGIIGSAGSGYAIRTGLHRHRVRDDLSRDFSSALTARRHGFRAVLVDEAICYVPRTSSLKREYRRKVRTISRGMETLYFNRDLLDPFTYGVFAWKLFSHKLCRWLLSVSALPALLGLAFLAISHTPSRWLLATAVLMGILAVVSANWPENRIVPKWLPTALLGGLSANLAVIHSTWRFFHGHEDHVWEPTRRAVVPS